MGIIEKIKSIFKKNNIVNKEVPIIPDRMNNTIGHVVTEKERYESEKFYVMSKDGKRILCGITDKYVEGKANYSFYFYNQYGDDFYVKEVSLNNYFHDVYIFKKNQGNADYERVTKRFLTNELLIDMRIVDKVKIYVNGIDGLYIFETGKDNRFYSNEELISIRKDATRFITMLVDDLKSFYNELKYNPLKVREIRSSGERIYYDDEKLRREKIYDENSKKYKQFYEYYDSGMMDSFTNYNPSDEHKISYMYSADESKAFYVVSKFVKDNGEDNVVQNEFDDDETINHIAEFNSSDTKSIIFMDYIISNLKKPSIYNIPVYDILHNALHTYTYYNNLVYGRDNINEEYETACKKIFNLLVEKNNNDIESTVKYLSTKYVISPGIGYRISANSPEEYQKIKNDNLKYFKEQYNNIAEYLIIHNEYKAKWKSELSLFKLIKEHYPDAVYQYRNTKLLGLQSFDIYIPSKNIAIEYQGKQHYESLDFFGGEEGLEKRMELDLKKKEICLKNGIKLIEWRYDEPITKVFLNNKVRINVKCAMKK